MPHLAKAHEQKVAPAHGNRAQSAIDSIAPQKQRSACPHYPTNFTSHSEMGGNTSNKMVRNTSLTRKGITPL